MLIMCLCIFMGASCINAADVNATLEVNQSSGATNDIPLDKPMELCGLESTPKTEPLELYGLESTPKTEPLELYGLGNTPKTEPLELYGLGNIIICKATLLDTSHTISENTPYLNSEVCVANITKSICESSVTRNTSTESFNNPHFKAYESKLTYDGQCLNCGHGNYAEENNLSKNRTATIETDFSDLNNSYNSFYENYENTAIFNCIHISRIIMTMPRNIDEEEQNLRNSLTINCNQDLDETYKDALIDLREYRITADFIGETSDTDLEQYDFTLNIEYSYDHMSSWCPDSLNSNTYGLEINNTYYDDISILEDTIEDCILVNSSPVIEEPEVSVENMLNLTALTYNTDIIGNSPQNGHCNKITITETLICNNCIFTNDFNQNGESIFNQRLLLLINYIFEDLIEELTPPAETVEFFDFDLNLSKNLLTNFSEAFENAEPHKEAMWDNESLETEDSYLFSDGNIAVSLASAHISNLSHLKGNGNTTAANDATYWGKTNAEAFKELWDIGENRFCLDILYINPLKIMISYMGIFNQKERNTTNGIGVNI